MLSLLRSHRGRRNPEGRRRCAAVPWSPTPELLEGRILLSAKPHVVAAPPTVSITAPFVTVAHGHTLPTASLTAPLTSRRTQRQPARPHGTTGTVTAAHAPTPPTVSITAPLNNSTIYDSLVSHTTTLTAIASDSQSGVASVQFRIDGRIIATDAAAPYSASWNTTSVADGPHTLTVIAKDRAGKTATTTETVTVVDDYRPPTVSLTAPLNNSTIYDSLVSHT